jgi:hypothetical protein
VPTETQTETRNGRPIMGGRCGAGHSVGVRGFNLNPALSAYLRERQATIDCGAEPARVKPEPTPVLQRRPLSARLSDARTTAIVERYRSGATARSLAAEYGVGLTAMKSLLRRHGAKKRG